MNLLVLSVSKKVQLIKKLKEACNSYSRKLFCGDMSINSPALYFGDEFIVLPANEDKTFLSALVGYCKEKNISMILPTSDRDICLFTKKRNFLLKNGIVVLMSESASIRNCLSNFSFVETCINHGLPLPKIYYSISEIEFPCVGKLDESQSTKGVFFIKNQSELSKILKKYDFSELIFQKHINSIEYSIDAFYGHKGNLISAIARERIEVINGESSVTETKDLPELITLADNLTSAFNFWGHITIQAFYDGTEINLIEINPRFGGASSLSFMSGLYSPKWTLDLIENPFSTIEVNKLKYNYKLLRYSEDFFL